jgi:VanZ family protein
VLYATLPLGRPVISWAREHWTAAQQQACTWLIFSLLALALLHYLLALRRVLRPMAYVCAIMLARLYWYELATLTQYPEERLHFIEYGVLAILLWHAWRGHLRPAWAYFAAALSGALIGYGDEGVQYLTQYIPNLARTCNWSMRNPDMFRRYFTWADVWLNALGALYGLALWATVFGNRRAAVTVDQ